MAKYHYTLPAWRARNLLLHTDPDEWPGTDALKVYRAHQRGEPLPSPEELFGTLFRSRKARSLEDMERAWGRTDRGFRPVDPLNLEEAAEPFLKKPHLSICLMCNEEDANCEVYANCTLCPKCMGEINCG